MIDIGYFSLKLKELSDLTGYAIRKDVANALHIRLKFEEKADFDNGIEILANSDKKVNLFNLRNAVYNARCDREERQDRLDKERFEIEAKAFWKTNYMGDGICSRQCSKCPAKGCDHIAKASIDAMKSMLAGDTTYPDVRDELSKKFPGAGFEKTHEQLINPQPF